MKGFEEETSPHVMVESLHRGIFYEQTIQPSDLAAMLLAIQKAFAGCKCAATEGSVDWTDRAQAILLLMRA